MSFRSLDHLFYSKSGNRKGKVFTEISVPRSAQTKLLLINTIILLWNPTPMLEMRALQLREVN